MDKTWSEMNKEMQALIAKKATFKGGVEKLLELRRSLFEQVMQIVDVPTQSAVRKRASTGATNVIIVDGGIVPGGTRQ